MSKIREHPPTSAPAPAPLAVSPTGDLKPYVIFTQLKERGPHIYAGWLEATDDRMAIDFAREHYGQDQECVNVMAIAREHITSSDGLYSAPLAPGSAEGTYQVFTQKRAGDLWISAGTMQSAKPTPLAAIEASRESIKQAKSAHAIWVVREDHIISTRDELIWRHTDQSYRLARGYGREVRAKWIAFRDEKKLAEYERDDLQEAF